MTRRGEWVGLPSALECSTIAFDWLDGLPGEAQVVVEAAYLGRNLATYGDLRAAAERWCTVGVLAGAKAQTVLASTWRARPSRGGCRRLQSFLVSQSLRRPTDRAGWKRASIAFAESVLGESVSSHVADALCIAVWAWERSQALGAGSGWASALRESESSPKQTAQEASSGPREAQDGPLAVPTHTKGTGAKRRTISAGREPRRRARTA